jgi:hypothetical protein
MGAPTPLTVNLTSIAINSSNSSHSLFTSTVLATFESSNPFLTLPRQACEAFEIAFGLQFDSSTSMYLVNDSMHTELLALDPNVTFVLNNSSVGGDVEIVLPYASFDLLASYPLYEKPTNYFPLRVATNDSEVSLGRALFQEVYV